MVKKAFLILAITAISLGAYAQKPLATFNHVALDVSNVDVSAAFYSKVLHLDSIKSPWGGRNPRWFSLGGNRQLHLNETKKENITAPKGSHIAFSVASVDDFIVTLKKAGIPYQDSSGKPNSVALRPDGVHQIYFRDPDGYLIEVDDAK